jgi:hypothetical protein
MTMAIKNKYSLDQSALFNIQTRRKLAKRLLTTERALKGLARLGESGYRTWLMTSDSGKSREIEDPLPHLKKVHARIAELLTRIAAPCYLTCPVKGLSYISNAAAHRDAKTIVRLDISNYFPSTTSKRVYWFFHNVMHCAPDVAGILTSLCTINGRLPTGSPASPLLSYFAHCSLWDAVAEICAEKDCFFTLYVDDITISGSVVPGELEWKVKKLIHSAGLKSNSRKERRYEYVPAEVTGVIVDQDALRVPKRGYKKLHDRKIDLAKASDPAARQRVLNSIRSILAQHNQIRQVF